VTVPVVWRDAAPLPELCLSAAIIVAMPHLSELHGAATHLAVVAIPVYAVILMLRRFGPDHQTLRHVEPWLLGAALAGVASAGVTGLLVWGQAQTTLRGSAFRAGTVHFWLGIAIAIVVLGAFVIRLQTLRRGRPTHSSILLAAGTVALVAVFVQGYIGGRMTYDQGVGIDAGGQLAQSAVGSRRLSLDLASGMSPVAAGRAAFSEQNLGCASCHGDLAQGARGPQLAGGRGLDEFRRVHAHGLFPPAIVTNADFAAIDAWLRTVRSGRGGGGEG
jgi:mono/diheme cytochrome c family protein